MPIKEIVSFGMGVVLMVAVTGGPLNLKTNLRAAEIKILREVSRTDNWGNPSPWAHSMAKNKKPREHSNSQG